MLNLSNKIKKVKEKIKPYENDAILILIIVLVALISFGLGRLSKIREGKAPITIENATGNISASQGEFVAGNEAKLFVASKNGAKYHYPWCSGAQNIKEENKIWFSSKKEAEKSGYAPAGNCKGL